MFQTGLVAQMMSQDLQYKLAGYYRALEMRYIPQEVVHDYAVQKAEAELAAALATRGSVESESAYQNARCTVRQEHYARFAARAAPCK
jgi:hypothetical protein